MPTCILGPLLTVVGQLAFNFKVSILGVKSDQFGQATVAIPGSLGYANSFCGFLPHLNSQLFFFIGKPEKKPIVDDDGKTVIVAETVTIIANNDHRFGDAALFSKGAQIMEKAILEPSSFKLEEQLK